MSAEQSLWSWVVNIRPLDLHMGRKLLNAALAEARDSRQCLSMSPQHPSFRCQKLNDHHGAPMNGHMANNGALLWVDLDPENPPGPHRGPVWGWSDNEEQYDGTFDTKEEAIEAGAENVGPGSTFFVGQGQYPDAGAFALNASHVLDYARDNAADTCGELCDDWDPNPNSVACQEVNDAVADWLRRHCPTDFYMIDPDTVTEHEAPEEEHEPETTS